MNDNVYDFDICTPHLLHAFVHFDSCTRFGSNLGWDTLSHFLSSSVFGQMRNICILGYLMPYIGIQRSKEYLPDISSGAHGTRFINIEYF